jgi:signal transduction histidine kinase
MRDGKTNASSASLILRGAAHVGLASRMGMTRSTTQKTLYFQASSCLVSRALFRRLLLPLLLATRLAAADPVLDTVAKIRALSPEEAAHTPPVRIEATVLYVDPNAGDLFVCDDTASTYVATPGDPGNVGLRALHLEPGMRVRIEGVARPGGYVPDMYQRHIEVIGKGTLPEPPKIAEDELLSPMLDSQWVEVPAVVTSVDENDKDVFALTVEVHGWKLKARIPFGKHATERAAALMQRPVRLQAVIGTLFNQERQMTGRYFFVPSFDQIIPDKKLASAVNPPVRATNELLRINDTPQTLVRVAGVVTQTAGNDFYLRDASGSVLVRGTGKDRFAPGDRVEAEGFAAIAPFRPVLRARKTAVLGRVEPPRAMTPDFNIEKVPRFQAELIELEANFLTSHSGADEFVLQCQMGERFFEALLPRDGALPKGLTPGDRIKLTGICELTTTHPLSLFWYVDGFRLHLPKTGGGVILRHAPWWTLQHVLALLGMVSAVALLSLAWAWLLRSRVKAQTETIGSKIKQVGMHEERQRIARELHDTVEQELAGLSIQLGGLSEVIGENQMPEKVRTSIENAQRILSHCREEARSSIRDLRSIELEQRGLAGALQELLPETAARSGADFQMQVSGEPRPIAGVAETHLLRIAQEGVANAAHHAAARTITVDLEYTPDAVTLVIRDDGCGFDSTAPAPRGHFGLRGMRERANKMQAALDIESAPGKGTTLRVIVPINAKL